jgi:hypothetical protein
MLTVYVEGIGLRGPGLESWSEAAAVLSGRTAYMPAPFVTPSIDLLPPAERRRVGDTVKLALCVAQAAVKETGRDAASLATVFTSSGGDGETIHNILETLTTETRELSPTRFHNSVHNAPSGYWALAMECREPSTTICAHDWSFGAGLLEAAAQAVADARAVAVIAYDNKYPEPLNAARPIHGGFGLALVLAPEQTPAAAARLDISVCTEMKAESAMTGEDELERLRLGNPAARSLPLLAAIARGQRETVILENAPEMRLQLAVTGLRA